MPSPEVRSATRPASPHCSGCTCEHPGHYISQSPGVTVCLFSELGFVKVSCVMAPNAAGGPRGRAWEGNDQVQRACCLVAAQGKDAGPWLLPWRAHNFGGIGVSAPPALSNYLSHKSSPHLFFSLPPDKQMQRLERQGGDSS